MAVSGVYVGSDVLTNLQTEIRQLSSSLEELYNTMVQQMNRVNEFWQDAKYEEFKQGYGPQIAKCQEIAANYRNWCTSVLQQTIDQVVKTERTDVSGSGVGSGIGTAPAAASAAAASAAAVSTPSSVAAQLDALIKKNSASNATRKGTPFAGGPSGMAPKSDSEPSAQVKKVFDQADEICKRDNGSNNFRAKLAGADDADFPLTFRTVEQGGNFSVGGKLNAGVEWPWKKIAKASAGGEVNGSYNSGSDSSEITGELLFKCVPDND